MWLAEMAARVFWTNHRTVVKQNRSNPRLFSTLDWKFLYFELTTLETIYENIRYVDESRECKKKNVRSKTNRGDSWLFWRLMGRGLLDTGRLFVVVWGAPRSPKTFALSVRTLIKKKSSYRPGSLKVNDHSCSLDPQNPREALTFWCHITNSWCLKSAPLFSAVLTVFHSCLGFLFQKCFELAQRVRIVNSSLEAHDVVSEHDPQAFLNWKQRNCNKPYC